MKAEFKEKYYEHAFIIELGRRCHQFYSPDQVDERFLGFDTAWFLPFDDFRYFLPGLARRASAFPHGITTNDLRRLGDLFNHRLPALRLNLFLQFKRPDYLSRSSAKEWSYWGHPYFRFDLTHHQQERLADLARIGGNQAAVVYAAAAFHEYTDLIGHTRNNSVIQNSNISECRPLSGHGRFTYDSPGHTGAAHSEPEDIESRPFETILQAGELREEIPFTQMIKRAAKIIEDTVSRRFEDQTLLELSRKAVLQGDIAEVMPEAKDTWLDAMITVLAFNFAFDVRTVLVG